MEEIKTEYKRVSIQSVTINTTSTILAYVGESNIIYILKNPFKENAGLSEITIENVNDTVFCLSFSNEKLLIVGAVCNSLKIAPKNI